MASTFALGGVVLSLALSALIGTNILPTAVLLVVLCEIPVIGLIVRRNSIARSLTKKVAFWKLFWTSRLLIWALVVMVFLTITSFAILIAMAMLFVYRPSTLDIVPVVWRLRLAQALLLSMSGYVLIFPVSAFAQWFSPEYEAYLCLLQSTKLADVQTAKRWLRRGLGRSAALLRDQSIAISPNRILFALNVILFEGKSIRNLVLQIAKGLLQVNARTHLGTHPNVLFKAINELERQRSKATSIGIGRFQSLSEKVWRMGGRMSNNKSVLFVIIIVIELIIFLRTGQPLDIPRLLGIAP
jgi:hypothetical protein